MAALMIFAPGAYGAPAARARSGQDAWRVLLIFSEGKDLPGNVVLEEGIRSAFEKESPRHVEVFTEHLDASRFSDETHYRIFRDYLGAKYAGQDPDLLIIIMARDYTLAQRLPAEVFRTVPTVFATTTDLPRPDNMDRPLIRGIIHRLDIAGTVSFAHRLEPELRKLVIIGGKGDSDQRTLSRLMPAPGLAFEFWTNEPFAASVEKARALPRDTAIVISSIFEDADGKTIYMTHAARILAPVASVPVYALSPGAISSGAIGGAAVDTRRLGERTAMLGMTMLKSPGQAKGGIEEDFSSTPMANWQALQRWNVNPDRLPRNCAIIERPPSLWREHKVLISGAAAVIGAQAITITALVTQMLRRRRAEAEILKQRDELAHVTRVSTMGQLASSLAHEINQPLGAILRNTEAAELFLRSDRPDLDELRAILADIRKDDQRAGGVIDRMRSLLKREGLRLEELDVVNLLHETAGLAMPDARARQVRLSVEISSDLPKVRGDRIQLQQVLLNLILNGMDAVKDGANGERSVILSAASTVDGQVEIRVTDSGTGIPPDKLNRVFDPFFTTKTEGLGMGLAISKTIVEGHGGTVRASNNPGSGATFSISLPANSLVSA